MPKRPHQLKCKAFKLDTGGGWPALPGAAAAAAANGAEGGRQQDCGANVVWNTTVVLEWTAGWWADVMT
jgi:hypothetical protein